MTAKASAGFRDGTTAPAWRTASLLDLDQDLGALLSADRLKVARLALRVVVQRLDTGGWEVTRLATADAAHFGLLVVDGVIAREVLLEDEISTELIGAGDVLRPWHVGRDPDVLRYEVRWSVLAASQLALLDRRLVASLARFPEVHAALLDRFDRRAERLAVIKAITQLNRVERRLVALFWHLASRWGRVTSDGVAIALTLPHRMLAGIVGARRPTVSTALAELADRGELVRRSDGTWLLTGEPAGVPMPQVRRFVPVRRRLVAPDQRDTATGGDG